MGLNWVSVLHRLNGCIFAVFMNEFHFLGVTLSNRGGDDSPGPSLSLMQKLRTASDLAH